ncbi:MAG: SDR family NAD(P)-dependent oxidoreductase, partial [Elusimicrobiota bacterium]
MVGGASAPPTMTVSKAPSSIVPAAQTPPVTMAAPTPPVPTRAAAKLAATLDESSVLADITALVSEKTGYPPDMLEPDLDMEADLGIDTVKQAELIGIIRDKYSIPRSENLSLKDYPTLRHVVGFVLAGGPGAAGETTASPIPAVPVVSKDPPSQAVLPAAPEPPVQTAASTPPVQPAADEPPPSPFHRWVLEAVPCDAEGKIPAFAPEKSILILAGDPKNAEPFANAIKKAGGESAVLKPSDWEDAHAASAAVRGALKDRPVQGIVDLSGLELESPERLTPASFDKAYKKTARALFLAMQAVHADLSTDKQASFLLVLTRMDGSHGASKSSWFHPLAGALTGLAKAMRKELDIRVKAVDFQPETSPKDMAASALAELGCLDGRVEVGFLGGRRHALSLARKDLPAAPTGKRRRIGSRSVVLITGGGQGLGAELAKELARRTRCSLILLGRTALAKEAATWARLTPAELSQMKKDLWEELKKDATRKATPALLEREFSKVTKAAALQLTIEELCRLGSKVVYASGDTGDASSVAQALREAGRTHKAIDLVIHAAGLEESKLLADKRVADFDRVFRAKAHGAIHLLNSVPPTGAQTWLFLSSVVGRFGNAGQGDYAAASDLLGKLASGLRSKGKTAVAVDLTAFSEIGMAARGSVEAFLKSQGVEFMPPKTGVDLMLREVFSPDGHAEAVLAGSMGKLDVDAQLSSLPVSGERPRSAGPAVLGKDVGGAPEDAAPSPAHADLGPLPER